MEQIIKEAEATEDLEHVLALNNEFHSTLYGALEQPNLMQLIQQLRNKVAPYNRIYLDVPGRKDAAWADHQRIYEAALEGDPEQVEAATRRHLDQVFEGIMLAMADDKSGLNGS